MLGFLGIGQGFEHIAALFFDLLDHEIGLLLADVALKLGDVFDDAALVGDILIGEQ